MPYIGTSPSNSVRRVHTYTATANQTTFTGASSEGITLSYADTNYIDVFQNGVLLGNADYTSTSGTSVVLAQGASADDLIVIVVYDVFSVADTVSKTNGGSFDSAVTMSNNLTVSGAFTSQGIDDNADATAITIDSSENVKVGGIETSETSPLMVKTNASNYAIYLEENSGQESWQIGINSTGDLDFRNSGGTDPAIQFADSGNVGIGATALSNRRLLTSWDTTGSFGFEVDVTPSSGQLYGQSIFFSGQSPDGSGSEFLRCRDNSTNRLIIFSDGDVDNHDNSYSGFSDLKLKEQIEDASSQWEDIKALTVRKFKFKTDVANGDSDAHWRLGVIAQEVETAGMNGLVKTNSDTVEGENGKLIDSGTTTKSVKYSILYMKAVKALQEAMTRIETLEAKVTALENAE